MVYDCRDGRAIYHRDERKWRDVVANGAPRLFYTSQNGWQFLPCPISFDVEPYGLSCDNYLVRQEERWPLRDKDELCDVRLIGLYEGGTRWSSELFLEVSPPNGETLLVSIGSGGVSEYMDLASFVHPFRREIFVFTHSGGSGGYVDHHVADIFNKEKPRLFPNSESFEMVDWFPMEGDVLDGYRVRIRVPRLGQEYLLDVSGWPDGGFPDLYDDAGKVLSQQKFSDQGDIKMMTPADFDGDGLDELVGIIPQEGDYKRYYVGDSYVVCKYRNGGWERIHNWFAPAPGIRIILDEAPEESSGDVRGLREGDGCR